MGENVQMSKKIRAILDSALAPHGYRTVHIGEPQEVSAIQFLHKKTIDKLEQELEAYVRTENCEAYGEGQNDERDHFADSE